MAVVNKIRIGGKECLLLPTDFLDKLAEAIMLMPKDRFATEQSFVRDLAVTLHKRGLSYGETTNFAITAKEFQQLKKGYEDATSAQKSNNSRDNERIRL